MNSYVIDCLANYSLRISGLCILFHLRLCFLSPSLLCDEHWLPRALHSYTFILVFVDSTILHYWTPEPYSAVFVTSSRPPNDLCFLTTTGPALPLLFSNGVI